MSRIITISSGKLKGRVIKISLMPFNSHRTTVVEKEPSTYNKPSTFFPPLIMSDEYGPILQQLGQLQGQMQSMVSAQHQQLKQAADLNVTMRIEIEKVNNSISTHKEVIEKRQDKLEVKLENIKVKVSIIAGGVAIGVNVAVQVIFHLWK